MMFRMFQGSQSIPVSGCLAFEPPSFGRLPGTEKMGSAFPQKMPFDVKKHMENWVNTYFDTIFRGLFTSINPSYFDVNKKGVQGFDTLPYDDILWEN